MPPSPQVAITPAKEDWDLGLPGDAFATSGNRGWICKRVQLPKSKGDDTTACPRTSNLYALVAPGSGACERVYVSLSQGTKRKKKKALALSISLFSRPLSDQPNDHLIRLENCINRNVTSYNRTNISYTIRACLVCTQLKG